MKHLKMFEGFSREDYYTVVPSEYDELVLMRFSPKELSLIKDKLIGFHLSELSAYGVLAKEFNGSFWLSISIKKSEDEWFYVSKVENKITETRYKCDQLEGLLKCIDDIIK